MKRLLVLAVFLGGCETWEPSSSYDPAASYRAITSKPNPLGPMLDTSVPQSAYAPGPTTIYTDYGAGAYQATPIGSNSYNVTRLW